MSEKTVVVSGSNPLSKMDSNIIPSRPLMNGMGQAVAERTILRRDRDGTWETWHDVANRVAFGNALLADTPEHPQEQEYRVLRQHLANGTTLMSGRHLQHGDPDQPTRGMEVVTNCATAAASFLQFYLLLNGCFRKGTKVKMADGSYKAIETIQPGDVVVSFNESTKRFCPQNVERLNINPPKSMVRVTLDNGETIVCTHDHKFLTPSGAWVEASALQGQEICQRESWQHKAPMSQEHRDKIAAALRGKKKSQAHREALRSPKSEDHKRAISESRRSNDVVERTKTTMLKKYGVEVPSMIPTNNPNRPEFYMARYGLSHDDALAQVRSLQSRRSQLVNPLNRTGIWQKRYWTDKGLTEEQACAAVNAAQIMNSAKSSKSTSRSCDDFLRELSRVTGIPVAREHVIPPFLVDAVVLDHKIVIEYFGDFWHMNPAMYGPGDIHGLKKQTAQTIWDEDKERIALLHDLGYQVFVVWESEAKDSVMAQAKFEEIRHACN